MVPYLFQSSALVISNHLTSINYLSLLNCINYHGIPQLLILNTISGNHNQHHNQYEI